MFALCSKITIGGVTLEGVYDVNIKRSIKELAATAVIRVPERAVVRVSDDEKQYVYLAKVFRAGTPVSIELGYDGSYNMEFWGYVKEVNQGSPLEVICEDNFYSIRSANRSIDGKGRYSLLEVIRKCGLLPGYIDPFVIDKFPVDNKPVAWILNKLKTDYGLNIYFNIEGLLNAYQSDRLPLKLPVAYSLSNNVIDYRDLKQQREEDVNMKVKAVCVYQDGTMETVTVGPEQGAEKTLYYYDLESPEDARKLAETELKRYRFNGFTGKIVTFLYPYALPGMLAVFMDMHFPDRTGAYFIEGTEVSFGHNGARRSVELGCKMYGAEDTASELTSKINVLDGLGI